MIALSLMNDYTMQVDFQFSEINLNSRKLI